MFQCRPRELLIYILSIESLLRRNQGSHDVKLQVAMAATFSVSKVLSICYNCVFGLSEDESICDKGEEAHAYRGT